MANRPKRLGCRASLFLPGAIVILQAAATLRKGEPDYRNHYDQPVSAHVVLMLGAALAVAALVPWPRRSTVPGDQRPRLRDAPRSAVRFGRNDPCPCDSGRKYKRCCLAAEEERRRFGVSERGAERTNGMTSITAVVNRGLSGW